MPLVLLQSCRVFQLDVLDFGLLGGHVLLLVHHLYPRHVYHVHAHRRLLHLHLRLHVHMDPSRIEVVHH